MKGIFAFDIDGTLTHLRDGIDPKVTCRLGQLVDEGWKVALLTGRVYSFATQIIDHLDFPYVLAVHNGADLLWMPEKKELKKNFLTGEILPQIEKAYEGIGEDFIIYSGREKGDFCYFRPERFSPEMKKYLLILEGLGGAPWQGSDFSFVSGVSFPLIKCFGSREEMERLYQKLLLAPQVEVSMIRDPIDPRLYLNLITHPDANKGSVLRYLRNYFNAPLVIAAGDDGNDRKMLEEADISIAIETAPKELLELADIVVKPARELGILQGIEEAITYANR